jgi:hypothetical protein
MKKISAESVMALEKVCMTVHVVMLVKEKVNVNSKYSTFER